MGYEWSNRKGDEGLKELHSPYLSPLFERDNPHNPNKLAHLIRQAFVSTDMGGARGLGREKTSQIESSPIPQDLSPYACKARLVDMIDFSKVEFNKAISLNPSNSQGEGKAQNPFENCKYELVKLGEVAKIDWGNTNLTKSIYKNDGKYLAYSASGQDGKIDFFENDEEAIILSAIGARCGKCFFAIGKWTAIKNTITIKTDKEKVISKFAFYLVNNENFWEKSGSAQPFIKLSSVKNTKIPLPPLEIQKQIVAECEKVEEQYNTIRMSIEKYQELIKAILVKCGIIANNDEFIGGGGATSRLIASLLDSIQELESKLDFDNNNTLDFQTLLDSIPTPPPQGWDTIKLNNKKYLTLNPSKREIANIDENTIISFVEMASVADKGYIQNKVDKPLKELRKGSYTYFAENDILIAKITPCMENGKCAIAKNLTNGLGMGSSEFHIFRTHKGLNNKFLFACLNQDSIRQEAAKSMTGSSGHRRVPINFYESLKIPLPPIAAQEKIVSTIERIESKIHLLDSSLPSLDSKKSEVLQHFLQN